MVIVTEVGRPRWSCAVSQSGKSEVRIIPQPVKVIGKSSRHDPGLRRRARPLRFGNSAGKPRSMPVLRISRSVGSMPLLRISRSACRVIRTADDSPRPAMIAATAMSGHAVAAAHTPAPANITATLAMQSLRVHSHTDRAWLSVVRYR
jgi:hypothetical protein